MGGHYPETFVAAMVAIKIDDGHFELAHEVLVMGWASLTMMSLIYD